MSILSRFESTHTSWGWVCGALLLVILATLTPQAGPVAGADFFGPLVPEPISQWRDVVQNVLLYLPFGFLLGIRRVSGVRVVLASAVLSFAIELAQFVVPGRDPIARDVLTNTAGGALGWWLARTPLGSFADTLLGAAERLLILARAPSRRGAVYLCVAWAVVVTTATNATCWLLAPDLPPPLFFGVASSSIDPTRGPLRIGGHGRSSDGFSGLIDEVRVYARARSSDEVASDMSRPVERDTPAPDLVVAFGFDSDRGPNVLDASGATRRTLVHETTWVPDGRFGGALSFNGHTSQVIVSDAAFDLSRGLTVEAWVFPTQPLAQDALVIADASEVFFMRATSFQSSLPLSGVRFGGAPRMVGPRRGLPLREWTHMATTYDGRFLRLYLNGELAGVFAHWSTHQPSRVVLDGSAIRFGIMRNPQSLPPILLGGFSLDVTVTCGALANGPAPFFLVAGIQSINALELLASGSEVLVRFPRNAQRLGLASVDYRIPGVLAACGPGQDRRFLVRGPLQRTRVYDVAGSELRGAGPGLGSAWSVLLDSQIFPLWLVTAVSGCFLAALVFPFGLWARGALSIAIAGVTLLLNVGVVPSLWQLDAASGLELFAIVSGLALGLSAARRRRQPAAAD